MSDAKPAPADIGLPLPYALVSFADHWTRAYTRFWARLAQVGGPVQAAQAEEALGLDLVSDGLEAWLDFYAAPMRMWTNILTAPLDRSPGQGADLA